METVLEASSIKRAFGSVQALQGASLSLHKAEWLGLLGPNGAGKTTLIRSIAGRVRPDAGTITLFGTRIEAGTSDALAAAAARARLGIVPQEIALYDTLTARENLETFGSLAGVAPSDLRDRVSWALEFTALADRAGQLVKGFSGGMKRRLNIACAVLHRPEVVLLDEPTVGVDPQSRERIWEMLAHLRSQGASILLTTHQLDEAQRVCDRIVIIDHGRVIADGTFDQLVARSVGTGRRVTLTLDAPWPGAPSGSQADGASVRCAVADVARELPPLLQRAAADGRSVLDIHVEGPTLQGVFIHLTGRELRE